MELARIRMLVCAGHCNCTAWFHMGLLWGPGFPFTEARQDPTLEALPKLSSPQLLQLDPDSPESYQFDVSQGCVSGRVLGVAVVAQCRCRGVCGRCKCCGVRERCRCCAVCGRCRHRAVMVRCSCSGIYVGGVGALTLYVPCCVWAV